MTIWTRWITIPVVLAGIAFGAPLLHAQEVQTGANSLATRVAPGESLPLAIRLSNFGSNQRVDVTLRYDLFDSSDTIVLSQSETVAVETAASYISHIPIPSSMAPGLYSARTSIVYNGQRVPATATQQFTVERKIYGIFQSDLIKDIAVILVVALLALLAGLLVRRHRRESLLVPHIYTDIPENVRVYYEILSDTIQEMQYHVGDAALTIAAAIPGLAIDRINGRVLSISNDPSEVIASIVSKYETAFGKKLNLSFTGKGGSRAIVR